MMAANPKEDRGVNAPEILVTGGTGSDAGWWTACEVRDARIGRSVGAQAAPAWSATPKSTIVLSRTWRSLVRTLRMGPLLVAVAVCVLFALLGTALVGESLGDWYGALDKPRFLIPLWAFGIVGAIYYVLFATVLYRILVHVDDRRGRVTSLALTVTVLFLNELWNYGFFGLESTLVGFLGMAAFLVYVTALLHTLRVHERFSAGLVTVYWA